MKLYFFCLLCYLPTVLIAQIPTKKFSLGRYWKEIPKHKQQIWVGGGFMNATYYNHFIDEVNYIPTPQKWTYTFRLKATHNIFGDGYPPAFMREIAVMGGKTFQRKYFMTTFSAGVGYIWGNKWLDIIGRVASAPNLPRGFLNAPLFITEKFSTLGLPIRVHPSVVIFKRIALGISLGTSFNRKRMILDGFLTLLVRVS